MVALAKLTKSEIEYIKRAAKMMPFPVDVSERLIFCHEPDLAIAEDNMTASHLRSKFNFHIQSCLPGTLNYSVIFNPEISNRMPMVKPIERSEFNLGDKFLIKSTGCQLEIKLLQSDTVTLTYLNRDKSDITNKIEALRKVLKMEVWIRIS
jgi:hypothetical protein